jgi:hypothetical protein
MRRKMRGIRRVGPTILIAGLAGCGDGKPSVSTSTEEATVSGTVKAEGKLVTQGEISFDPSNYLRKNVGLKTVPIGKDGTYSIKTLAGENRVRVEGFPTRVRYLDERFNAEPGANRFDIDLRPMER